MGLVLVVIGFLMLYVYDINSITIKCRLLNTLFFLGTLFITLGSVGVVIANRRYVATGGVLLLGIITGAICLSLLIYTLFFALPFEDTYKNAKYKICDKGMYALCRHPGVLWFAGVFGSLVILFQNTETLLLCGVANLMNVLYIILQDVIIFPEIFEGYNGYKESTPFLIPNKRSIVRFVQTMREVTR